MAQYINSKEDALHYWNDEYGLPESFSSFDELNDVEDEIKALKKEKESVDYAIKHRDLKYMNEFTINRAIELHFLIEVGDKYLEDCHSEATIADKDLDRDYKDEFDYSNKDDLFENGYEEN